MGCVVDTSIIIQLERQNRPPLFLGETVVERPVTIAAVTVAELLAGVARADTPQRRRQRSAFVESVLALVLILPYDLGIARRHAEIWSHLTSSGQMIGLVDMMIAATALSHGYELLTLNVREFQRVPGLTVAQPHW